MSTSPQRAAPHPDFPPGRILLTVRCRRCGYNLKGADPAGACPECGLAVWPSLQPHVEPPGDPVALLDRPRRIGAALVIVAVGMLLSAAALWWPYLTALAHRLRDPVGPLMPAPSLGHYVLVGVLAGAAFAATFALTHPTGALPAAEYRRGLLLARLGLIAWALLHGVLLLYDAASRQPVREWYDLVHVDAVRSLVRLGLDAAAVTMIIGFRPVFAFLARRSVSHRRGGGASRQGFLAILLAIASVLCGDVVRLGTWLVERAGFGGLLVDNAALAGTMLVLVGSVMMTLSLLNLAIDSCRLAGSLARRTHRLEEIIG